MTLSFQRIAAGKYASGHYLILRLRTHAWRTSYGAHVLGVRPTLAECKAMAERHHEIEIDNLRRSA